jgi:hypothetical protein
MKKFLLLLSLIIISFTSCSKNDDGFTETSIFGTWKAIQYKVGDDATPSSNAPEWETLENGHEIPFNENMTYFYKNFIFPSSCCTATNSCIFEIETEDENDNRLSRDYDCNGTIEPAEYLDSYHFNGKYLIITSNYYDIGEREYKYVRVQKNDNSSL